MDFLSHGLWAGAVYKAAQRKTKKPLRVWLAAFWGVFPDLLAFTVLFTWLFWNLIFGGLSFSDFPQPDAVEPVLQDTLAIFRLTSILYSVSHSAFIFLLVFGIIFLILRRPIWELGGWLFHILLDIPTHSYQFYPTPFLWPLSDWKFDGFSWATPWFLIINYFLIIVVYILLRKKKKHTIKSS